MDLKALRRKIELVKYPALILLLGLALILLPGGKRVEEGGEETAQALQELLSSTEGVGRVSLILSDNGAVVLCDGAENAKVRMDILHAVRSYTGFGADAVTVLKMRNESRR